jgi:hypothetical protein
LDSNRCAHQTRQQRPATAARRLVCVRAEVIGLNAPKLIKKNTNGIAFALSASDLLNVLHKFYPDTVPVSAPSSPNRYYFFRVRSPRSDTSCLGLTGLGCLGLTGLAYAMRCVSIRRGQSF